MGALRVLKRGEIKAVQPSDAERLQTSILELTKLRTLPEGFRVEGQRLLDRLNVATPQSKHKVYAFSSSLTGEGVSTVCCSAMLALAQSGAQALYIDANFQSPVLLDSGRVKGLSDVLLGRADINSALQEVPHSSVSVMTKGTAAEELPNEATDESITRILQELRSRFSTVLLDLAPPLTSPFVGRLARATDGMVLVVEAHKTDCQVIGLTVDFLRSAGVPVLGLAYNKRRFKA